MRFLSLYNTMSGTRISLYRVVCYAVLRRIVSARTFYTERSKLGIRERLEPIYHCTRIQDKYGILLQFR